MEDLGPTTAGIDLEQDAAIKIEEGNNALQRSLNLPVHLGGWHVNKTRGKFGDQFQESARPGRGATLSQRRRLGTRRELGTRSVLLDECRFVYGAPSTPLPQPN